eukprot:381071_1
MDCSFDPFLNWSTQHYAFCFEWYCYPTYRSITFLIFNTCWHSLQYFYVHANIPFNIWHTHIAKMPKIQQTAITCCRQYVANIFIEYTKLNHDIIHIILDDFINFSKTHKFISIEWYHKDKHLKYCKKYRPIYSILSIILYIYLILYPLVHITYSIIIIYNFAMWSSIISTNTNTDWNQYLSLCVTLLCYHPIIKSTLISSLFFDQQSNGNTKWDWFIKYEFYTNSNLRILNLFYLCCKFYAIMMKIHLFISLIILLPALKNFYAFCIKTACIGLICWSFFAFIFVQTDPNSVSRTRFRSGWLNVPNLNFLQPSRTHSYILALVFIEICALLLYRTLNVLMISQTCFHNQFEWNTCFEYAMIAMYCKNTEFDYDDWTMRFLFWSWVLF